MKPNICGSGHKLTVAECCDDENFVFLTVNRISDVTKPSRCHAYVLPNNDVFIWSFDTNQMVKISSSSHIGQDGKSAYELALEEGYQGTLNEWLKSLIGRQGDKGDRGLSAYEVALAAGFKGTMEEWLASLKGNQGDKGDPGNDGKDGRDGKDGNEFTAPIVLDTITGTTPTVYNETLEVDGEQATGSIFVKDMGAENEIVNLLPKALPKHRKQSYASTSSISTTITNNKVRFTATSNNDPYYRPVGTNSANVLKPSTSYTLAFKYKVNDEAMLRVRMIFGTSATVSEYFQNEGVGLCTFKTDATGRQYLSFEPVRVRTEGVLNSSQVGDWFELEELQLVEGEYTELPYRPAPEDLGIVHGQPNLMNGTSNEWEEFTFSAWDTGGVSTSLSSLGLKVGDKIACRCEIDNSQSSLKAKFKLVFRNDTSAIHEVTPSLIQPGEVGFSQGEYIIPEGTTNIYCAKVSKYDGTTQSTIRVRRNKLIKGSLAAMDEWTPSQADSGLVPHSEDFLSKTLNLFSDEEAILGYFQGWSNNNELEPNVKRACSVKIPVKVGEKYSVYSPFLTGKANYIILACYDSKDNKTYMYRTDKWIVPDTTHTSSASSRPIVVTIPAGTAYVRLAIDSNGGAITRDMLKGYSLKFIEGDFTQNAGMVPFNSDQYAALADPLKYMRVETLQVGRGAGIRCQFPVISEIERRHPYLFDGLTLDEKIEKYLDTLESIVVSQTSRGGGLLNGNQSNRSQLYMQVPNGLWWGHGNSSNTSAEFINRTVQLTGSWPKQIHENGVMILAIVSKQNSNTDLGVVSDGITPAWVEVKDIKLVVELEINGKSVVEEIAAEVSKKAIAEFSGQGVIHKVSMDFVGKISGSTTANANRVMHSAGAALNSPSLTALEAPQNVIDDMCNLDGKVGQFSNSVNDNMKQALMSWNIIEDIKRRYPGIFEAYGATDLASQVAVAKSIIESCKYKVWGFGSSPTGYKLSTGYWLDDKEYSIQRPFNGTNETMEIAYVLDKANSVRTISKDGFIYVIAYAEATNGTIPSVVNIDYACLEYEINLKLSDIIDARLDKQKGLTFYKKFPFNKGDGYLVVKQKNGIVELQLVLMNAVYPVNEKIYDNPDIDEVLSKIFKTFRLERMNVNNLMTNEVVELESLIQFAPSTISFVSSNEVEFTDMMGMLTFTLVPENEL